MANRRSEGRLLSRGPSNRKNTVAESDEQLHAVLETLEECRAILANSWNGETADLVSIAILDLRMKLNGVCALELKALCEEMLRRSSSEPPQDAEGQPSPRPQLRLVK